MEIRNRVIGTFQPVALVPDCSGLPSYANTLCRSSDAEYAPEGTVYAALLEKYGKPQ
ncbi:MAG: hypothetical protein JW793_13800 [Acidobacteria bacterium]|nr:hypothetical protein [Acidobacteriota bacterium]